MDIKRKIRILSTISMIALLGAGISACNKITDESSTSAISASQRFAAGTKGVKINTYVSNTYNSFGIPTATPSVTPIPTTFPGGDGTTTYLPGVSPATYYDLDGTSSISKPSWLLDFQMGITSTSASSECATFGGGVSNLDPANFYRVSEFDCGTQTNGTGGGTDPVFFRIVLDRDPLQIGSAENLLIQVEYQASGIHANSDGTGTTAEDNLDQLWKIYWNTSLASSETPKPFGIFIPPNYSNCTPGGTSNVGAATATNKCNLGFNPTYRGSPVKVRQFIIPLSAYPTMKVIQFSRVKSRITATAPDNYVPDFCATNQPLCLGVVIRSVTITRM